MKIPVRVVDKNGTYMARVLGAPYFCSCTSGPRQAAERLAQKYYGDNAEVRAATNGDYSADQWRHYELRNPRRSNLLLKIATEMTHIITKP